MRCSVTDCPVLNSNQDEMRDRETPEHWVRESRMSEHTAPESVPGNTSQKISKRLHVDNTTAPTIAAPVSTVVRGS